MARTDPLGGVAERKIVDMNCNHRMQAYAMRQKRPLSTNYRVGADAPARESQLLAG